MVNKRQIILGLAALLIGILVYLTDRPPEQTWFVSVAPAALSLYGLCPPLFGPLAQSLPDFLHIVAFSLLTAGILSSSKKGAYLGICLFWLLLEVSFELGQHYQALAVKLVPDWFEGVFLLDNTRNYFAHGTYSHLDLMAFVTGALMAYIILIYTNKHKGEVA